MTNVNASFQKIVDTYHEYPRAFWVFTYAGFIDRVGSALLHPFLALYLTARFGVGMSEVGIIFAAISTTAFIGSALGGAIADKFGRKKIMIFSLITSSLSSLSMGLSNTFEMAILSACFVGIFSQIGGPAHEAIVADVLPESKRVQGYAILRVFANVACAVGPAIGGFLAGRSYMLLFVLDVVVSAIAAIIVFAALPETKPAPHPDTQEETLAESFRGYGKVFMHGAFIAFTFVTLLEILVYMNSNTTLGVYLRDQHHIPEEGYGWLLSLNAIMVVFIQYWITRKLKDQKPLLLMAIGTALYAIGFAMYGFFSSYLWFVVAIVIITIGEMVVTPVSQSLVAGFAPREMRGRYMAVFGVSWGIAYAIGPLLAGLILDGPDPRWLWYACGIVGAISALGFVLLNWRAHLNTQEA